MPNGDGMGPFGEDPQSGRGLGYCAGNEQPGFASSHPAQRSGFGIGRRGRGRGRGRRADEGNVPGRGRRRAFAQPMSKDQEAGFLKAQAEELKKALQEIQTRIDRLDAE